MIDFDETLVRVEARHFVAGVIVKHERVVETAPILKYMKGWSADRVRQYVSQQGWRATVVRQPNKHEFRR